MTDITPSERVDRNALVLAIWMPAGFLGALLLRYGTINGNAWWTAAAFAIVITCFVGHILVNVLTKTRFTAGETALGGVVLAVAIIGLLLSRLLMPGRIDAATFMTIGLGLTLLVVTLVIYLLIALGPRRALEEFDVIRDNNLRVASRLPRWGRRE